MVSSLRRFIGVSFLCSVYITAHPTNSHNARHHVDSFSRGLPSQWYHDETHPVDTLFKRADPSPMPGTAEWAAQYPPPGPGGLTVDRIPKPWLDALHAAEAAGLIPDVPIPIEPMNNGSPVYPNGTDPTSPQVCSSTAKCKQPDDVWDGPDGTVAIGFDDGPEDGSPVLYDFLKQNNIPSTHFMIGSNIIWGYNMFQRAFSELNADIAVHTWDHPHMTTLSNELVLAELAWTMQIISDCTGGRVPKFWRPPYGDSDNRVRAIAKHILGLTQINWNQDSADWTISAGQTTRPAVEMAISGWYAGPKSPGLIILEHELTNDTSGAFIDTFPEIAKNGWKMASTIDLLGGTSWQNADSNTGDVKSADIILPQPSPPPSSTTSIAPVNNQVATKETVSQTTETLTRSSPSGSPTADAVRAPEKSSAFRTPFATTSSLVIALILSIVVSFWS